MVDRSSILQSVALPLAGVIKMHFSRDFFQNLQTAITPQPGTFEMVPVASIHCKTDVNTTGTLGPKNKALTDI